MNEHPLLVLARGIEAQGSIVSCASIESLDDVRGLADDDPLHAAFPADVLGSYLASTPEPVETLSTHGLQALFACLFCLRSKGALTSTLRDVAEAAQRHPGSPGLRKELMAIVQEDAWIHRLGAPAGLSDWPHRRRADDPKHVCIDRQPSATSLASVATAASGGCKLSTAASAAPSESSAPAPSVEVTFEEQGNFPPLDDWELEFLLRVSISDILEHLERGRPEEALQCIDQALARTFEGFPA